MTLDLLPRGWAHHSAWYLSARNLLLAHWFAVAALIATAVGITAAHVKRPRFGWMLLHLTCMLVSFYILIGGGVNEAFLRISFLRRLVPSLNAPVVGMTHFAVMIFFAVLIAYFNYITLIRLRAKRPGVSAMHARSGLQQKFRITLVRLKLLGERLCSVSFFDSDG